MAQTVRFTDTVSYTEADQADFNMRMMRPQGVIPESVLGTLIPSAPGGMIVRIGPGEAFVQGFQYMNDANVDLTIGANSSGSTRIDVAVVTLNRSLNTMIIALVAGVAGAGVPALTQVVGGNWQFPLAQITVVNGAASINAGNITDVRVFSRWPLAALDTLMATDADVTAEANTRAAADSAEVTARTNADNSEASTRAAADSTLTTNLNAEITNRSNAVSSEATTRANADTANSNAISTETTNRTNADSTLQTNINNEATTRANNDTSNYNTLNAVDVNLNGRVSALETGMRVRAAGIANGSGGLYAAYGVFSMVRTNIGTYEVNLNFTMPNSSWYVVATCNNFNRMIGVAVASATMFRVYTSATPAGGGNYVNADENFSFIVVYNG